MNGLKILPFPIDFETNVSKRIFLYNLAWNSLKTSKPLIP